MGYSDFCILIVRHPFRCSPLSGRPVAPKTFFTCALACMPQENFSEPGLARFHRMAIHHRHCCQLGIVWFALPRRVEWCALPAVASGIDVANSAPHLSQSDLFRTGGSAVLSRACGPTQPLCLRLYLSRRDTGTKKKQSNTET